MDDKYFLTLQNFSDEDELKYHLGLKEEFKSFWFKFAKNLGFYDTPVSIASPYGKEIQPLIQKDTLLLQRAKYNNYLKIAFSNFRFVLDPTSFLFGEITQKNLQPKETLFANYYNYTKTAIETRKSILLTKSTTTTASSDHKIATSVELTASTEVNTPILSDVREVSYTFGYEYNMGNQQGKTDFTKSWDKVLITIPPRTKTPLKIIVYSSLTTAPFTALANVLFSVSFTGYLSVDDNTYKDQKVINPRGSKHVYRGFKYTFGNSTTSALDDINSQIANRNTPDDTSPWNWDKFLSKPQVKNSILPQLRKGISAQFNGELDQIDSTNVIVQIDPSESL